jgi:hypothetical protein
MDSIRKRIFQNIEDTLDRESTFKTVVVGTFELYKVERPAAGIIPDEETTENQPDETYVEALRVSIRIVVDEDNQRAGEELDDAITAAHVALLDDPKRGGLAADTVKVGVKWLFLDEHYPRAGADLNLLITYATEEKNPTVSNLG